MKDQAFNLRKIMKNLNIDGEKDSEKTYEKKKAKVFTITSGKGGVGKTNIAVNLAISIRRLGYRVIVVDVDFGLANVEIITGTHIRYTISDTITKGKELEDIMVEGPEGIKLISGGVGLYEKTTMNEENINCFIKEMEKMESMADFIIIDTGAGVSRDVLNFIMAADETLLITTPDPTSIMDAYTILKALTINGYKGKLNIVANIVNSRTEAYDTYNKLYKASKNFLNRELEFLGYIEKSDVVNKAVKNQYPFLLYSPSSSISKKINIIALKFADPAKYNGSKESRGFAKKLMELFSIRGGFNDR